MISFHASPDRTKMMTTRDTVSDSSRKRRWERGDGGAEEGRLMAREFSKKERSGSGKLLGSAGLDIKLGLETPLPVEWQRCLDIQSGEVHFYNMRTNKTTCKDPGNDNAETTSDPPTTISTVRRSSISLKLELNLQPYDNHGSPPGAETPYSAKQFLVEEDPKRRKPCLEKKDEKVIEEEEDKEEEEMVATVCVRCHMLVMLCVSRPACPNCKFVHPKPEHTPFALLFKPPKCTTTTTTQLLC